MCVRVCVCAESLGNSKRKICTHVLPLSPFSPISPFAPVDPVSPFDPFREQMNPNLYIYSYILASYHLGFL